VSFPLHETVHVKGLIIHIFEGQFGEPVLVFDGAVFTLDLMRKEGLLV